MIVESLADVYHVLFRFTPFAPKLRFATALAYTIRRVGNYALESTFHLFDALFYFF